MRRALIAVLALACVLALAACGGGGTRTVTVQLQPASPKAPAPAIHQPAATCPPGRSFMGCSASRPSLTPRLSLSVPAGRRFPDVSSWQGHPDWAAAKGSIAGAVAKLGEYSTDPTAAYNVSSFKRLGIPYAVYWFVRPTGCAHEGAQIAGSARALGVRKVIIDEEVSGIAGYAACLNPYVRAATGQDATVYKSAGQNFDSTAAGLDCWVAAYGPSSPPACFGRSPKAFQYTDGRYGFPTYIPGIGMGDVSLDYGLLNVIKPKPKPKPKPALSTEVFYFGADHARETTTVHTWDRRHCANPVARPVCQSTHRHLVLLENRLFYAAHHPLVHGRPTWGSYYRGYRFQQLSRRVGSPVAVAASTPR